MQLNLLLEIIYTRLLITRPTELRNLLDSTLGAHLVYVHRSWEISTMLSRVHQLDDFNSPRKGPTHATASLGSQEVKGQFWIIQGVVVELRNYTHYNV